MFDKSFPHRHNADGSYDSICTACLRTVATAWQEAELSFRESTHVCNTAGLRLIASSLQRTSALKDMSRPTEQNALGANAGPSADAGGKRAFWQSVPCRIVKQRAQQ